MTTSHNTTVVGVRSCSCCCLGGYHPRAAAATATTTRLKLFGLLLLLGLYAAPTRCGAFLVASPSQQPRRRMELNVFAPMRTIVSPSSVLLLPSVTSSSHYHHPHHKHSYDRSLSVRFLSAAAEESNTGSSGDNNDNNNEFGIDISQDERLYKVRLSRAVGVE